MPVGHSIPVIISSVRKDHLFVHLKECEWRFNHRYDLYYHHSKPPLLSSLIYLRTHLLGWTFAERSS